MTGKTDEEIINESLNCSKMYIECVKEAIEKARASERKKVAKEIFTELDAANDISDCCGCSGISLKKEVYLPIKQKYLSSNTEVIE